VPSAAGVALMSRRRAPLPRPLFEHDDLPHPDPIAQPVEAFVDFAEIQAMGQHPPAAGGTG
jgi:hypothetical protein